MEIDMKPKEELIEQIKNLPKFEIRPVFLENQKEIENFRAVVEKENEYVVAMVSPKYTLIQFEEVFLPIVEEIEKVKGWIGYYFGSAYLVLFPEGEEYKISENEKIGILIKNSVDRSNAISIEFIVKLSDEIIYFPVKELKKYKRKHIGKVKSELESVEKFISKIKELWKAFYEKLNKIEVDEKYAEEIFKRCRIAKTIRRKIKNRLFIYSLDNETKKPKLYELFLEIVKEVGKKKYKSEIHKIKRLRKITEVVYEIAITELI